MSEKPRYSAVAARANELASSPWAPVVLGVLAALVALASSHFVYPEMSWNRDEPVYLWQAELLTHAQITVDAGARPELFHPWLSGLHDGQFFTQYPLGWPIPLAIGKIIGSVEMVLAAVAALAVVGTYALAREVTGQRRLGTYAASLLLVSPIFAIQSGTRLTYVFALGLGTFFATNLLKGIRTNSKGRVVGAGVLLGWMFITRNYDAVVWAAAVGGYLVVTERKRWRELLGPLGLFIVGFAPLLVAALAHNAAVTGSALKFPITVADPMDGFGFGERRLMPGLAPFDYNIGYALRGTAKNALFTPWFLAGAYLGVAVAAVGVWAHRKERSTWLLVAIGLAFPLAYFPFWGVQISSLTTRISGPIYSIPAYVPLCILMAKGLMVLAKKDARRTLALGALMVAVTVPMSLGRLGLNRHLSRIQGVWAQSTEDVAQDSIVLVGSSQYLMQLNPNSSNGKDREGKFVFMNDGYPSAVDEILDNPDRVAYMQRVDTSTNELAPSEHTKPYGVELVPIEVVEGRSIDLTAAVKVPEGGVVHYELTYGVGDSKPIASAQGIIEAGKTSVLKWRLGASRSVVGNDGIVLKLSDEPLVLTVGTGKDLEEAKANPIVRSRILVKVGPTMKMLLPTTTHRPDRGIDPADNDGVLVWRDEPAGEDLQIGATPR